MLTINDLNNGKRRPYTLKEIVELDYPDFWGCAKDCIRIAKELQNMMLELLPIYSQHLPSSFEQLKGHERALINYLKVRSIYGLAYAIWESIDTNCRKMAQAKLEFDLDQVEDAKLQLVNMMSLVENLTKSIDDVCDEQNGYDRLKDIIDSCDPTMNFFVKRGTIGIWGYRDIDGTIQNQGYLVEEALSSLLFNDDPQEPNVGGLMERPEDGKTVIMY